MLDWDSASQNGNDIEHLLIKHTLNGVKIFIDTISDAGQKKDAIDKIIKSTSFDLCLG